MRDLTETKIETYCGTIRISHEEHLRGAILRTYHANRRHDPESVAAELGCSLAVVCEVLNKNGLLDPKPKPAKPDLGRLVLKVHDENPLFTARELSDQAGCSIDQAKRILRQAGRTVCQPPTLLQRAMVELRKQDGRSRAQIAHSVGCCEQTVYNAERKLGYTSRHRRCEADLLDACLLEGLSDAEAAEVAGVSIATACNARRRLEEDGAFERVSFPEPIR